MDIYKRHMISLRASPPLVYNTSVKDSLYKHSDDRKSLGEEGFKAHRF